MLNKGKSILVPTQELDLLGFLVNSIKMSLYLPRDKLKSINREFQIMINNPSVSIRTLSRLLGKLSSSVQAVFLAPLHYHFPLMAKTMALKKTQSYELTLSVNYIEMEVITGGIWSHQERLKHINCSELMAGGFAIKPFSKNRASIQVKLLMGNTTAIAYINRMRGSSPVLTSLVYEI